LEDAKRDAMPIKYRRDHMKKERAIEGNNISGYSRAESKRKKAVEI